MAPRRAADATAEFVCEQLKELAKIAKQSRFEVLAYSLDMAILEAESIVLGKSGR